MANRITHIRLSDGNFGTQRITHVKGLNSVGEGFTSTVSNIIDHIKSGNYAFFYTLSNGYRGEITYVDANPDYIRTKPDGTTSDNLLNLPHF